MTIPLGQGSTIERDGEPMRYCSKCCRLRKMEDFHKDASRPYGRGFVCRVCDGPYRKGLRVRR